MYHKKLDKKTSKAAIISSFNYGHEAYCWNTSLKLRAIQHWNCL